jgi:hypothetical protein
MADSRALMPDDGLLKVDVFKRDARTPAQHGNFRFPERDFPDPFL